MSVSTISIDDANASVRNLGIAGPAQHINFFATFGTSGCLLNCEAERTFEPTLKSEKDESNPRTRQHRKQIRRLRDERLLEYRRSRQDWFDAKTINASAKRGCGSCAVLQKLICVIFNQDEENMPRDHEYSIAQYFNISQRRLGDHKVLKHVMLFQPHGIGVRFEWFSKSEFLAGKAQSMTHVRDWLQECRDRHSICSAQYTASEDAHHPARLLDLFPIHCDEEIGVKLFDTVPNVVYKYACLSHRWDEKVELSLTTIDNLKERMVHLDLEILPTNFRDAIEIARYLDIRYSWIDSICIIQDGDQGQDKLQEIAKMGSIYQQAQLTIAAVSSKDSSQGCFINDNWQDTCLLLTDSTDKAYLVGARVLDGEGQAATVEQVNARYPLLTRGWVFQERLLSTRFLQCGYGEFLFECHGSIQCECKSSIAPHAGGHRLEKDTSKSIRQLNFSRHKKRLLRIIEEPTKQGSRAFQTSIDFAYWHTIVTQYMELDLKYSEDTLPAMAGCAKLCGLSTGQKYLAGLWSGNLSSDLLWHVTRKKKWRYERRPAASTAPSWSWASVAMGQTISWMGVDNSVTYRRGSALLREAILEVFCEPESVTNPFGRVANAYLRLRATLFPWYLRFTCTERSKYENPANLYHGNMDLHVRRTGRALSCRPQIPELNLDSTVIEMSADANLWDAGLVIEPFSQCLSSPPVCKLTPIFLLPALHLGSTQALLVLVRIPPVENKPNCYRRIGITKLVSANTDDNRSWTDMVQGSIQPQEEELWLF